MKKNILKIGLCGLLLTSALTAYTSTVVNTDVTSSHKSFTFDYSNKSFVQSDMSHQDISNSLFKKSKIIQSHFESADLTNSVFKDATIGQSHFENAKLNGTKFINCNISQTKFNKATLKGVEFINCKISQVNLDKTHLNDAVFKNCTFKQSSIKHSCLANSLFHGNLFDQSSIDGSNLVGAVFRGNRNSQFSKDDVIYKNTQDCIGAKNIKISSYNKKRPTLISSEEISTKLMENNKIDLTINFKFNSDQIMGNAHAQILEIANALKSNKLKNSKIQIQGHTDSIGSADYNMDLSYRRAVAVVRELISKYHFSSKQFAIKGFGESQPISSNMNEAGRAENRRVTLVKLN